MREEFRFISEGRDLALAVRGEGHLLAALGAQSALVMIDEADERAVACHVGLVSVSVEFRPGFRADLNSGVRIGAQAELAVQLEVRGLAFGPDEIVALPARVFDSALGDQHTILDPPPSGGTLPTGEVAAVEQLPFVLFGAFVVRRGRNHGQEYEHHDALTCCRDQCVTR